MAVAELIEKIDKLTVLELSDLVKQLEEKYGVSAAAPMAIPDARLRRLLRVNSPGGFDGSGGTGFFVATNTFSKS